ncbi:hypothetical protein [Lentibacillus sp. JNUCC-1]|uniref:hypothetical protein n=1 Tax=Lentibacillus sp. JNUCC-1 TaxID=2654513 RepID=UPI001E351204|nr:hypothetical protein [Lentibacillus sp. JNUCC-1]
MKLFRSKIDGFFITFIGVAVGVIAAASFWPLFLEDGMQFKVIMILSLTFFSGPASFCGLLFQ